MLDKSSRELNNEESSEVIHIKPNWKNWLNLVIFSLAQYIDVFGTYATIIAIPIIGEELSLDSATSSWVIDGRRYLLVFASFLLVFGKLSDLYSPKLVFVIGLAWMGILHLGAGFCKNAVALVILKALSGWGAAATIPSGIKLIVMEFPDEEYRRIALSIFCLCGGIANVSGTIFGGLLTSVGWQWVLWIISIITIPLSLASFFTIPDVPLKFETDSKMDFVSSFIMVAGNTVGWPTAHILVPLILAILLLVAFFYLQTRMSPRRALIPPRVWRYKGMTVLFCASLTVSGWWTCVLISLANIYQDVWHWDPTKAAVHFLPLGIASAISGSLASTILKYANFKLSILVAYLASLSGVLLISFGDEQSLYWRFAVPGMVIGSAACAFLYTVTNVGMVQVSPDNETGLAGSMFQMSQQTGSAIMISIFIAIRGAVNEQSTDIFKGTSAGMW
ncbi:MFS general substrate transporter [Wallemia mellicola]|nr:MFS general substrate transporter [Wallemia mellicola]